jgi:ABC-2 type transport system permease protein
VNPRSLAKLAWVESKLFLREPLALLFTVAFPLVVMIVIAGVFASSGGTVFGGVGGSEYYVAGYVGIVLGSIGLISLPAHLAVYQERGILRRFRASSISNWAIFATQAMVSLVVAIVSSLLLVLVALPLYRFDFPRSFPAFALGFMVSGLSFLALGLLLATLLRSARVAQAVGLSLFFPLWLLSGAGPPPAVMPDAMRRIADLLPLTHAVRSVQEPWFGRGLPGSDLIYLLVLLIVAGTATAVIVRRG